jgi:hypothetical protein
MKSLPTNHLNMILRHRRTEFNIDRTTTPLSIPVKIGEDYLYKLRMGNCFALTRRLTRFCEFFVKDVGAFVNRSAGRGGAARDEAASAGVRAKTRCGAH